MEQIQYLLYRQENIANKQYSEYSTVITTKTR